MHSRHTHSYFYIVCVVHIVAHVCMYIHAHMYMGASLECLFQSRRFCTSLKKRADGPTSRTNFFHCILDNSASKRVQKVLILYFVCMQRLRCRTLTACHLCQLYSPPLLDGLINPSSMVTSSFHFIFFFLQHRICVLQIKKWWRHLTSRSHTPLLP